MRAVGLVPKTSKLELIDIPQPTIQQPNQVLIKVLRVGVCGTDREIAKGDIGEAPPGHDKLVIGHEMLGRIAAVGSEVQDFAEGDLVVATVRRGCGHCACCAIGAADFCTTGDYVEHGIKQLNGFMTEYVVDDAAFVVHVPEELVEIGVLLEPLSVGQKAIEQSLHILRRLPCPVGHPEREMTAPDWGEGIRALVAGSGPIGMLGAMILRAHGAAVTVVDLSDEDAFTSHLIKRIGATHVNGKQVAADKLDDHLGQIDLIFEATGAAPFSFNLIDALGVNGVYAMTGIPGMSRCADLPADALMRQIVLNNQVIFGSVNASHKNFADGVADLQRFRELWGDAIDQVITKRVPLERFMEAIEQPEAGGIKSVIEIAQ